MSNNTQSDLDKELVESGKWTRIDEIIREVKQLYKRERNARAHRTNLLLGQKFLELRKLVTGTDEDFNPNSTLGRRWGKFVKSHLKGCGVSRATTYRCAQAWKAASAIVPEAVLTHIAEREEMIGVAVSGEKPLGKYTLAMETAMEAEPDLRRRSGRRGIHPNRARQSREAEEIRPHAIALCPSDQGSGGNRKVEARQAHVWQEAGTDRGDAV